jgi:hypothetical protein
MNEESAIVAKLLPEFRIETGRACILEVLGERFGKRKAATCHGSLHCVTDLDKLSRLNRLAVRCASIEAFQQGLRGSVARRGQVDVMALTGREFLKRSTLYAEIGDEARIEARQASVLEVLEVRFGKQGAASCGHALQHLTDLDKLIHFNRLAARCASIKSFLRGIRGHGRLTSTSEKPSFSWRVRSSNGSIRIS